MERKGPNRSRGANLRAVPSRSSEGASSTGPVQEIVAIALGDRMVFSEMAEVWTVRGILRDGRIAPDLVGELSFVAIPGTEEPATAVTGFIAPSPSYSLAMPDDSLWPQLRNMIVQLGYDIDGFYASIGVGGRYGYYEDFRPSR